MKRGNLFLVCILAIVCFSAACSKKDDDTPGTLQGKWNFTSYVTNDYYAGKDHTSTIGGTGGDYMDFREDGKLYVRLLSFESISTYNTVGTGKVVIDGADTFDIQKNTKSELVLYQKTYSSAQEYTEVTYNLKK